MTRKMLGHVCLGENGTLYFWHEDQWIYPEVTVDVGNGESASISLQHMSHKEILNLAEKIKVIAAKAKKSNSENPSLFENDSNLQT